MKDNRYHLITLSPDRKDIPEAFIIATKYDGYTFLVKDVIRNDTCYDIPIDFFVSISACRVKVLFSDESFDVVREHAVMEIL